MGSIKAHETINSIMGLLAILVGGLAYWEGAKDRQEKLAFSDVTIPDTGDIPKLRDNTGIVTNAQSFEKLIHSAWHTQAANVTPYEIENIPFDVIVSNLSSSTTSIVAIRIQHFDQDQDRLFEGSEPAEKPSPSLPINLPGHSSVSIRFYSYIGVEVTGKVKRFCTRFSSLWDLVSCFRAQHVPRGRLQFALPRIVRKVFVLLANGHAYELSVANRDLT
jgi:hypothetical protein